MFRVRDFPSLLFYMQCLLLSSQCVHGTSNLTVFGDHITHDWSYWPRDSATRESTAPGPVHSGKYALRVEFFKAFARLALQTPAENALDTTQYAGIAFWGFGGPTGVLIEFLVDQDAMGHQPSKSIKFELQFGAWQHFYFTVNQLGNPSQIANLVWKSAAGSPEHTHFYLDDIVVVRGDALVPIQVPVPEPLTVFEERLAKDWNYWPWDSAVRESTEPGPVHRGTYALRVQFIKATAGVALQTPGDVLDATQYAGVEFWGFGGPIGALIEFLIYQDVQGLQRSNAVKVQLKFGLWKRYYIPMDLLGNPATISSIVWQGSAPNIHFYLDDIILVGGRAVAARLPVTDSLMPASNCYYGVEYSVYPGYFYNGVLEQITTEKTIEHCASSCIITNLCLSASYKQLSKLCAMFSTKSLNPEWSSHSEDVPESAEQANESSGFGELTVNTSIVNQRAQEYQFTADRDSVYIYEPHCAHVPQVRTLWQSHLQQLIQMRFPQQPKLVNALQQMEKATLMEAPPLPVLKCDRPVQFLTLPDQMFLGQTLATYAALTEQECAEKCFEQPLCSSANFVFGRMCEILAPGSLANALVDQSPAVSNTTCSTILYDMRCPSGIVQDDDSFAMVNQFVKWLSNQEKEMGYQCGVPYVQPRMASGFSVDVSESWLTSSAEENTRLFGTMTSTPHSWPWQAALYYRNEFRCGATLIHPHYVLTAANCIVKRFDARHYTVMLGGHSKAGSREEGAVLIGVDKITVHPLYHKPVRYAHNVAVLQLARPVQLSSNVSLACLAKKEFPPNTLCMVTGWGKTEGALDDSKLHQVTVPIIPYQTCNDRQHYSNRVDGSSICAGFEQGGPDSCTGDSGGPLVCKYNGRWLQAGIASWGQGCGRARKPGVYTNVAVLRSWIMEQLP